MWSGTSTQLEMVEGDYGLALPFTISGVTFGENDNLRFTFKRSRNGEVILEKNFDSITDNTVSLELTESESALFKPGMYVYSLDWYQGNSFLGNIISNGVFKVVDKA